MQTSAPRQSPARAPSAPARTSSQLRQNATSPRADLFQVSPALEPESALFEPELEPGRFNQAAAQARSSQSPAWDFSRISVFPPSLGSAKSESKGSGVEKPLDAGNVANAPEAVQQLPAVGGPALGGPGQAVPTGGGQGAPVGPAWTGGTHVVPNFPLTEKVPARSNADPATTVPDNPTFTGEAAIDAAASKWRFQLKSVEGKGTINLVFYTDDHYPAPTPTDDSGDLTNVTKDNWKAIVTDLDNHKTGVAGAWSAYRRTRLHEHYHWETEWQGSVKTELPKAETDIDKEGVDLAAAADAAAAKTQLTPRVTNIFSTHMQAAKTAYAALGDSPGDPPYVAGSKGAVDLIARVKAYATSKHW